MNADLLDRLVDRVQLAVARGESIAPQALTLLLRRYVSSGRPELEEALGPALTHALDAAEVARGGADPTGLPEWLTMVVEAAAISEDERLGAEARALVTALQRGWPERQDVRRAMKAVEACLAAAHLVDGDDVVPVAIDELERVVGIAYQPGEGLAHGLRRPDDDVRGDSDDHAAAASALLTAFSATGRLPYAMLAEELVQPVRRSLAAEHPTSFALLGEAARVLCRLAALHGDADYRQAAVMAPDCDYAADAARLLAWPPDADVSVDETASYALALDELLRLR